MRIISPRVRAALCFLLSLLLLLLCACGSPEAEKEAQPTVIEQGAAAHQENEAESSERQPEDPFPDKGADSTVEDLTAALAKVESYYFEQSVPYPSGQVFMQVWYKDGLMKLVTSVDGYCLSESYYDYNQGTVVEFYPGSAGEAYGRAFDPGDANAPKNPKMEDYSAAALTGSETLGRQSCLILETDSGDRLWVGTRYGFPLRVEYTDSLGERYQVDYRNLSINTLSDEDVALPGDLQVVFKDE
ncbi:MAG: hypothetical protein IKD93_03745 [Firmicutes bacterium]|nr:hypothetical protein [Bacillota bacterium]